MPADLRDVQLHLVNDIETAMSLKRWLSERREGNISVDTESGGLNPHKDRLRMVQFGDMKQGWAIPWERWGGVVEEVFDSYDGPLTMHHGCFDWRFLQVRAGITARWATYDDTMTLAALDNPLRPKGLKPLGKMLVDATATAGQKTLDDGMKANKWTWDTVPIDFPPYWIYSALDPVITSHLEHQLKPRVLASCPDAYDLELATNRICANMMMAGLTIDYDYIRQAIGTFDDFSERTRKWLATAHSITSPMSGGQLRRAFERLGEAPIAFTPQGAPRYDKATLEVYQASGGTSETRTLAKYLLAVRHADKMKGSYLENFIELADDDGVIHASINTIAARTGRMSVTDPALQTLPRDDKVIRGAFVPRPGHVFISCDLDQIEARLAAHFSEDPGLIQAFIDADEGGADFFCGVASGIWHTEIVKSDPRRQTTKNVVYGSLYGAGAETMARTAGIPLAEMEPVKRAFDATYPGLRAMIERLSNEAMANDEPHIRSMYGRKLMMDRDRAYTQACNALIQGSAAEIFKSLLVNMDAAGMGKYMRLPIHDEILLEVPVESAEEALRIVESCMTDRERFRVPITAGGKIMHDRWSK